MDWKYKILRTAAKLHNAYSDLFLKKIHHPLQKPVLSQKSNNKITEIMKSFLIYVVLYAIAVMSLVSCLSLICG